MVFLLFSCQAWQIYHRERLSARKLITALKLKTTISEIHCIIAFTPERYNKKWQRYLIRIAVNMADMGITQLTAYHFAHWVTNNTECSHGAIMASACRCNKNPQSRQKISSTICVYTCRPMTVKALLQLTWLKSLKSYQTWDHMPWHTSMPHFWQSSYSFCCFPFIVHLISSYSGSFT